jgi:hypothetical protein
MTKPLKLEDFVKLRMLLGVQEKKVLNWAEQTRHAQFREWFVKFIWINICMRPYIYSNELNNNGL